MHTFILQDWTTIRGSVTTVTQGEAGWLDLTPFQDLVFWIDCREESTSPTLTVQTSPTKDETLFTPMFSAITLSSNTTPVIKPALMSAGTSTNPPVARYIRWQLASGTTTWDATFRILVAANSPGT